MAKKTCFVVQGFGEKTDFTTGRKLDLDKSYRVIKKAVEAAGLECIRADEIKHSQAIDIPMYEQLLNADLVIADLSTYDLNAAYELGIRYGLRQQATIIVAEKQFTYAFDVSHMPILPYELKTMKKQVFLGGACGTTTWREAITIPALEAAGITYYNPQLGIGEWTEAQEVTEMKAKEEADVFLFVLTGETRGVASVAEVSYLLATHRPLALALTFIPEDASIDGWYVTPMERDDLNRGRLFIRTMAAKHGIPVFATIPEAVQYAIELAQACQQRLTLETIQALLADIDYRDFKFLIEQIAGGFHLQLCIKEADVNGGPQNLMYGRKWFISELSSKSDIVRTAFKAVITWQEHEVREFFRYQGARVFGPHLDVDNLAALYRQLSQAD